MIASVIEPFRLRRSERSESENFLNLANPSVLNSGVF